MRTKILFLLLLAHLPLAQAQTQWRLEAFLEYFGHVQGTALGARVKGFVGSRPNNPYNVVVAESHSFTDTPKLRFYTINSPQDTIPRWVIPGADVEYGDFNGDGLTDFAVWKSVNYSRYVDTVLVYLGSITGINMIPTLKLSAEKEGTYFGLSMCVGDLNNDRIDDLVITAPDYYQDFLGQGYGRVYVYFGGDSLKSVPSFTITGSYPGARLGGKCAIGDFNGDGFNDLALLNCDVTVPQNFFCYLSIYFGSAKFDTVVDLTGLRSYRSSTNDLAVFDTDGDSKTDLLWTFSDSLTSRKSVFIHYGGKNFQQRFQAGPDFIIPAPVGSGDFGNEICNAGDMNGDGDDDIVVAAYSTGQENGIVFVYTAGKALDDQFDAARGQSREGNFGFSIDGVGDINHDGFDDIIVGAPLQPWSRYEGYFGIFLGDARIPTRVAEKNSEASPADFVLGPIHPNPLTYQSIVEFKLSKQAVIEIKVYNILGKEVMTFLKAEYLAGQHEVVWNGRNHDGEIVPSGIYFVRMRAFSVGHSRLLFEQTDKFTVVR